MDSNSKSKHQFPLLDLPPELREQIYTYYFIQTTSTKHPHEPPLTQSSKHIRHESLPIYYNIYTLPIQTFIRSSYHGQIWLRTEPWYRKIPHSKLKWIRHLQLKFALIDRYTGQRVPIDFFVEWERREFSFRHGFARSWFRDPHRISDPADFEDLIAVLRGHLLRTLRDVLGDCDGGEMGSITAEGIDRLVKIDPDSLPL